MKSKTEVENTAEPILLIAIDVGSGFTKVAKSANDRFSIPSLVSLYPDKLSFGEDYKSLDFKKSSGDNLKFLTGDEAKRGNPKNLFDTINETWHGESWWFALLYRAIAAAYKPDEINGKTINLSTGLPQKLYSSMRNDLLAILDKEHSFSYGDDQYRFNIKPIIIPQAAGALIFNSTQDETLFSKKVGVIDIGTFTTGLSVLDDGAPVDYLSTGLSVGMNDVFKLLSASLKKEYSIITNPPKMPSVVSAKEILVMDELIDISNHVDEAAKQVSKIIIEQVGEAWGNARDMSVFLTGGGSVLFYDFIKESITHTKKSLSGDPFYDVVMGMYSYAHARL